MRNWKIIMSSELVRMWEEAVMTYFKILYWNISWRSYGKRCSVRMGRILAKNQTSGLPYMKQ
jgi:hypothetical protein